MRKILIAIMRVNKDSWFCRNVQDRRGKKCLTDVTTLEILTKIWRAQMLPINNWNCFLSKIYNSTFITYVHMPFAYQCVISLIVYCSFLISLSSFLFPHFFEILSLKLSQTLHSLILLIRRRIYRRLYSFSFSAPFLYIWNFSPDSGSNLFTASG